MVCTLSWQEAQVPMMCVWSNIATGRQPNGVWQSEQSLLDRMWLVGLAVAPKRAPAVWQDAQSWGYALLRGERP